MGFFKLLEQKPAVTMGALALVVLLLVVWVGCRLVGGGPGTSVPQKPGMWFMDLKTGELFTQPPGTLSPVMAPSGAGQGVRAHVFTCGDCDEDEREVLYLEMISERGRKAAENAMVDPDAPVPADLDLAAETLVAPSPAPGAEPLWISAIDPDGQSLRTAWKGYCDGKPARVCTPRPQ